ncbi:TlpA family protein disulfide reductase [Rubinisphaera margarita]|uniref:TlpA family protein disulfide reductase n=1 Tax=Rubinisphaera margarita TaxID=2909586 RepID=UPI001EE7AC3A|nr:TlpA disulfide reductase family protein [Rubinisphaera margarita]MCG6157749.1 TlpA family protein disulfide reductase [Rubinisphaera margarita]
MPASRVVLLVLLSCSAGCNRSESVSEQDAPQQPAPVPKIVQAEPTDRQLDDSGAAMPVLKIRPATQSELTPEIQTASLEVIKKLPLKETPAASGTPEWDLEQIAAVLGDSQKQISEDSKTPEDVQLRRIRDNNQRIVSLASHAISLTHLRPEKEAVFNAAVYALMEARFQLALQGDEKALQELYDDSALLGRQRPESIAAVTAAGTIVRLAETLARRTDSDSPWLSEYVRQAKLFATNFPAEEPRAIVQLLGAGELCEERQLTLPAIECYSLVSQAFPQTPFGPRIEAALRRMELTHRRVAIEGPTYDGQTVSLKEFEGQQVLVVFWSSRSHEFAEQIPALQDLVENEGFAVLGICLDNEEEAVGKYIAEHKLPGKHIFYQEPELRGASQPLARQYGIDTVPSYWFIDSKGVVQATQVSGDQLKNLPQRKTVAEK